MEKKSESDRVLAHVTAYMVSMWYACVHNSKMWPTEIGNLFASMALFHSAYSCGVVVSSIKALREISVLSRKSVNWAKIQVTWTLQFNLWWQQQINIIQIEVKHEMQMLAYVCVSISDKKSAIRQKNEIGRLHTLTHTPVHLIYANFRIFQTIPI